MRLGSWSGTPGIKPLSLPSILLEGLKPHPPTEVRVCAFSAHFFGPRVVGDGLLPGRDRLTRSGQRRFDDHPSPFGAVEAGRLDIS